MGHRRKIKKSANNIAHSTKGNDNTSNIIQQIEKEEAKEKLKALKQKNREDTFANFEKNMCHIFRIIGIIAFGIVLLVTFLLIIWCIVLYCRGDNEIANVVVTVIQLVTGILSLVVGVWALILTIWSNKDTSQIRSRHMNINTSYANIIAEGMRENDVNEDSLR